MTLAEGTVDVLATAVGRGLLAHAILLTVGVISGLAWIVLKLLRFLSRSKRS